MLALLYIYVELTTGPVPQIGRFPQMGRFPQLGQILYTLPTNGPIFPTTGPIILCHFHKWADFMWHYGQWKSEKAIYLGRGTTILLHASARNWFGGLVLPLCYSCPTREKCLQLYAAPKTVRTFILSRKHSKWANAKEANRTPHIHWKKIAVYCNMLGKNGLKGRNFILLHIFIIFLNKNALFLAVNVLHHHRFCIYKGNYWLPLQTLYFLYFWCPITSLVL